MYTSNTYLKYVYFKYFTTLLSPLRLDVALSLRTTYFHLETPLVESASLYWDQSTCHYGTRVTSLTYSPIRAAVTGVCSRLNTPAT